jgi:hypothetical protein
MYVNEVRAQKDMWRLSRETNLARVRSASRIDIPETDTKHMRTPYHGSDDSGTNFAGIVHLFIDYRLEVPPRADQLIRHALVVHHSVKF